MLGKLALIAGLLLSGGAQAPTPEQAFRVLARQEAPGVVQLTLMAAPGTALYRDEIEVEAVAGSGFVPRALAVPAGTVQAAPDGAQEVVLRGQVDTRVEGEGSGGALRVRLRGCADVGICYPPIELQVPIHE